MKNGVLNIALLFVMAIFSQNVMGQFTVQHQPPTVLDRNETNIIEFFVPGINEGDILEGILFYRNEGDLGFSQKEIIFNGSSFIATFSPEELTGTRLEYYFQLSLQNVNQDIFYPETLPSEQPIELDIVEASEPDYVEHERIEGVDYTIISPRPGNGLASNDAYIAIALYYDPDSIEPGVFRLFVDNVDVTAQADTSDFFISYVPKGLRRGIHNIRLDYLTEEKQYSVVQWEFKIVDPKKADIQSLTPSLVPAGRVELTARNQVIAGDLNNAYTARTYLSGAYGLFSYSINGFFTSQESDRLQPQNRYAIKMKLGEWWDFEAGHVYPTMSRFTISGRRMYGINTSLHTSNDNFNVQFIYGHINRKVTNLYQAVDVDTVYATADQDSIVDQSYTLLYNENGRGTFKRNIIGGRVGLGNPEKFQFGLQAMKVQDDTTSIFNVLNYTDLVNGGDPTLYQNLTANDRSRLAAQPELLSVDGGSPRPKGNFVAGADLRFAMDQNKIRFQTETVASVLNNDIYGGPLDSLRAADLGFEDIDQGPLDILEQISRIIIINENVSVLPLRFNISSDSTDPEIFFPTSILGSNSELSFNYPGNTLSVQYRWVGPEFVSLANSTIRKDIAGFTVSDRFRLVNNQVYVTLGVESLRDNVTDTKEATTRTNSYRSNISWYPVRQNLPRISGGFRFRTRDNGLSRFNPLVENLTDSLGNDVSVNRAVQNVIITTEGDTLTTSIPRLNKTLNLNFSVTQRVPVFDMVHDATLSISTLRTTDDVFAYGDVKNTSVSLNVTSQYEMLPLRTQLGLNFNNTEAGDGQLDIGIFGMYASGSYFLLDGKLNINGRLAFTTNTSRSRQLIVDDNGDQDFLNDYYYLSEIATVNEFGTYVFVAGAEYKLNNDHSFVFNSNFTNVTGGNYQNDRVVQLRYIYRF